MLTTAGLEHDRSFMVIGDDGRARTQRKHPRLALIRPQVSSDGSRLALSAPVTGWVDVDVDTTGTRRGVNLFGIPYTGVDQGDEVAEWLSETLGNSSRLVRVPPEHVRVTDGQTLGTSGYADSCPVHVVSQSSLDLLNRKLVDRGAVPLPMDRFRPNIVITGRDEPHLEDRFRRVRIANTELGYAKLAIRCVVTTVDQSFGARSGPEPLKTLAGYRRATEGRIAFGTKFAVAAAGKLSVGDEMSVQWKYGRMTSR